MDVRRFIKRLRIKEILNDARDAAKRSHHRQKITIQNLDFGELNNLEKKTCGIETIALESGDIPGTYNGTFRVSKKLKIFF